MFLLGGTAEAFSESFYITPRIYMTKQSIKIGETQWETIPGRHNYLSIADEYEA
jgi:hypothetical protein